MSGSGSKSSGWFLLLLLLGVFLIFLAVLYVLPITAAIILYKKYKWISSHSAYKRRCFVLMVWSIGILFCAATVSLIIMLVGTDLDFDKIAQHIVSVGMWIPQVIGLLLAIPLIASFFRANNAFEEQYVDQVVTLKRYTEELEKAVEDRDLSDQEIQRIKSILDECPVPEGMLNPINRRIFLDALYDASEDLAIDKDEMSILNRLSKALSVHDSQIDYANEFITKVSKVRGILEGTIEAIEPPSYYIPKRGEVCYFCEGCELYENVTQTAYMGASFGLGDILPRKLLLNPRIYAGKRINYNSMKKIDVGALVITNRRLAFIGDSVSRDFSFAKIFGINIGYDGIQINRSGKVKKEIFRLSALDKDVAAALIMNLTKDA